MKKFVVITNIYNTVEINGVTVEVERIPMFMEPEMKSVAIFLDASCCKCQKKVVAKEPFFLLPVEVDTPAGRMIGDLEPLCPDCLKEEHRFFRVENTVYDLEAVSLSEALAPEMQPRETITVDTLDEPVQFNGETVDPLRIPTLLSKETKKLMELCEQSCNCGFKMDAGMVFFGILKEVDTPAGKLLGEIEPICPLCLLFSDHRFVRLEYTIYDLHLVSVDKVLKEVLKEDGE